MRPRYNLARRKAAELLKAGSVHEAPVPVEMLAERTGAVIRYEPFDGKLSGMLYRSEGGAVIGVNSLHPTVRQRFSIAHEIGHLLLHQPELHVDEHAFVAFRDLESSKASDPAEIEANQFAAALLMPTELLLKRIAQLGDNPDVSDAIHTLAQTFQVSQEAMTIRLSKLGWLTE
jgi:Zn-dependent peptidase ImmA (M78 family)